MLWPGRRARRSGPVLSDSQGIDSAHPQTQAQARTNLNKKYELVYKELIWRRIGIII